ncbi:hypothetical protein G6F24_018581 [Rhizopus arrhizus]|nr:hypothetical protein G6F24_018581 [Rhizopus arrhizus]
MPVLSKAAISAAVQRPMPVCMSLVSGGAYQSSTGMTPPVSDSDERVAPRLLRGVWQAAQCPSPSTR